MDVCCLNRPVDDLSQDRIYFEAEAVLSILSRCEGDRWVLLASGAIDFELSRLSDEDKLEQIQTLYSSASERVELTEEVERRAAFFQKNRLKPFDSIHLALAEAGEADVFLSTDDRLLRVASKMDLKIKTANPVSWLMEVLSDDK